MTELRRMDLTMARTRDRTTEWGQWGPWELNARSYELEHYGYGYSIDLESCTSSPQVLDWIAQIAGKTWGDDSTVAYLVRAFDDLLCLQATLCSCGQHKTISREVIRARIDNWVACR